MNNLHRTGPSHSVVNSAIKAVRTLVAICQTRLELAITELEEEKANVLNVFILSGLCLLFTLFSILSALVLLFWAVSPDLRFLAFSWMTGMLFILAITTGCWALFKVRRTSLLQDTRHQLKEDLKILGVNDE